MHRGRCALGWLGGAIVLIGACKSDPCEKASPTVRLELILAGVALADVRSLEILLDRGSDRFRRVYNVDDQLADGRTSLSIEIEPAPDRSFELGVDVRAFDARDGSGEVIASRAVTMQLEPNGCNDGEIELLARTPGKDAGPDDAGPIDAMPMDADPADGGPRDADPIDADPMDADPADAPPDPDAGCSDDDNDGVCNPDDNCPDTPNPSQEDTDGVAAYPIAFAPVV